MDNNKWIFLCDVDGTLVTRDGPLDHEVIKAAQEYIAAGGLLALCTGRSVRGCTEITDNIAINAPSILLAGGMLYDFRTGEVLSYEPFRCSVREAIQKVLETYPDMGVQVYTPDEVLVFRMSDRLKARGVVEEVEGPVRSIDEMVVPVAKIVLCCDSPEDLESCRKYFPAEYCNFSFASTYFVDIVPTGFGKADAMEKLSLKTEISFDRFFCAGDGLTDVPVMKKAAVSFAPANAMQTVLEAADHIVPPVSEGGMAKAFRKAIEIMKESNCSEK